MRAPTLDLSGSHFEFGLQHGRAFRDVIRAYAEERVQLAGLPSWTGVSLSRQQVLALAEECVEHHRMFSPELTEELEGMAKATDLSLGELIVSGGFTDFVDAVAARAGGTPVDAAAAAGTTALETAALDDCTAFLVPGSFMQDGLAALGQTWDMHEGSAEHVVLLRGKPKNSPAFTVFTTAGAVGMIGMNEAGLSVGITNLMGARGRPGVTWPFVVREMLTQETTEGALKVLARAHLAGARYFMIMDAAGSGAHVEAMVTFDHVTLLGDRPLVHTNHCLLPETVAAQRQRDPVSQLDSEARLADAERLLAHGQLTVEHLQAVTADTANICHAGQEPRFVGTCGAVIMRPASREMWTVAGRPSQGTFARFEVGGA